MKVTKIKIKNLFGISEIELDGKSAELKGTNGTGKTSILDAIRLALMNEKNRGIVIRNGESEGEILLETDSSLSIHRKIRSEQADYKMIKEDNKVVNSPESYLKELFTPFQLNPIKFIEMNPQEQNKALLSLIEFEWDKNYIEEQFGELPVGVNYDQHILQVLDDIQSEKGYYYQARQDLNREIKIKEGNNTELIQEIPENYNSEFWRSYDFNIKYAELNKFKEENSRIERAKTFAEAYNDKIKNAELTRDNQIKMENEFIDSERNSLNDQINKYNSQILLLEEKLTNVDSGLNDKVAKINAEFEANKAKIDLDNAKAVEWLNKEIVDVTELESEVNQATEAIRHLNTYDRFKEQVATIEKLTAQSEGFTEKIGIARNLPAEILKTATIPVENLTVVNGQAMIDKGTKGVLPIGNLSDGEKLDLCVDVTLSNSQGLKIILIDGVERLSETNKNKLYAKCKIAGLQFLATQTTDSDEMEVVYL